MKGVNRMGNNELAKVIIEKVGGKENIISVTNCVTRLRFVLRDDKKADDNAVKSIKGVMGLAVQGGQYQVIIGTKVGAVAEAVSAELGMQVDAIDLVEAEDLKKDTLFNRFFKTISGCIFPFMGLMTAAGMIRGILTLLVTLKVITGDSGIYQILYAGGDGFMYFLPIMIGFSAGKKFGTNPYLTAVLGAALVYPNIVAAYNDKTALTFLGIPVILTSYANSIFPVLLASWAMSKVEKFWKKLLPDILHLMFVPFCSLVIMLPLTFLAIGPVMTTVSSILANGTQALWNLSPVVGGIILGAFWQVVVIFGLHYAFIPILVNNIATMGVDPINAVLGMTVMALAGTAFGYALRQKDKEKQANGLSCGLTALLGVTEPVIYSIALPERKPFVCAFIGGGIGGGILAFSKAAMQGFGGGGIFQFAMMVSPTDSMNVVWFGICAAIAFTISGVLCFLAYGKSK